MRKKLQSIDINIRQVKSIVLNELGYISK